MLEVNGVKKDLKKRLSGISSPCSRPMSNIEGYNYTFYDPDYCWEPFLKYLVDEKQSKKSKCSAPPPKVLKFPPKSVFLNLVAPDRKILLPRHMKIFHQHNWTTF